jgi:hypothetical protein
MLGGAASSRSMERMSVRIFEGMTTESYCGILILDLDYVIENHTWTISRHRGASGNS